MHINILAVQNGVGLSRDAEVLRRVLRAAGHAVTLTDPKAIPQAPGKALYDANIHVEIPVAEWWHAARRNILVPNQEWFYPEWWPMLSELDAILVKTRHAIPIFAGRGVPVVFTSFTSGAPYRDHRGPIGGNRWRVLHIAGRSIYKGTRAALEAWNHNAQWRAMQSLVMVGGCHLREDADKPLEVHPRVTPRKLYNLRRQCMVALCPSEAEGFGHYIAEAMRDGALVVTTNGAPMTELITAERGVLIPCPTRVSVQAGIRHLVDPRALNAAVWEAMTMGTNEMMRRRRNAQAWYADNHAFFVRTIREVFA
jgi:hypothetical protein